MMFLKPVNAYNYLYCIPQYSWNKATGLGITSGGDDDWAFASFELASANSDNILFNSCT